MIMIMKMIMKIMMYRNNRLKTMASSTGSQESFPLVSAVKVIETKSSVYLCFCLSVTTLKGDPFGKRS